MTILLKLTFSTALAAAAALSGVAPASAATAMPKQPALASHVDGVTQVASKKKRVRQGQRYYNDGYANDWSPAYPPGYAGGPSYWNRDTVGSTGYNGSPYGYNRYSGRQNYECKIDLGYGRTAPCDAGNIR